MVNVVKSGLIENVFSYDYVLVGIGTNNSFSGGFAYDIGLNFPSIKIRVNMMSNYLDRRLMGSVALVTDRNCPSMCVCYVHNGGYRKGKNGEFIDYNALENCLRQVSSSFKGKKIASPLIGASKYDGNGDRERILDLYKKYFTESDVDVYDYEQETFDDVMYRALVDLRRRKREKLITYDEYIKEKNLICWKRKNGIFKEMPEGYACKKGSFSWDDVINVKKKDLEK